MHERKRGSKKKLAACVDLSCSSSSRLSHCCCCPKPGESNRLLTSLKCGRVNFLGPAHGDQVIEDLLNVALACIR